MSSNQGDSGATSPSHSDSPVVGSLGAARADSSVPDSLPRHLLTARLASPVPPSSVDGADSISRQTSTPKQVAADKQPEFRPTEIVPSSLDLKKSNLTSALQESPVPSSSALPDDTTNGLNNGVAPTENPEIINKHLVQPQDNGDNDDNNDGKSGSSKAGSGAEEGEFSSLQLQGGDITRQVYRWTESEMQGQKLSQRRRSFNIARPEPEDETMNIHSIRVPGGFRRDYLRRTGGDPDQDLVHSVADPEQGLPQPQIPTSSFLEFLTLYGHFGGEELEEDDEMLGPGEYFSSAREREEGEPTEETGLLPGGKLPRKPKDRAVKANNTFTGAILLLLKSFVGTGVLFLPRAFLNGGMLFSSLVLVSISALSYYCFILLVNTRNKINGSFGDIGEALYGKNMRKIILASIALSQFGFVSAYIVFVSANLQAFILAVTECETFLSIKIIIFMQLIIFLPLSLIRDIAKLGFTALVADVFILLGLVYLYGYGFQTIAEKGVADIQAFNPSSWTLFIGTAIFSYEGIGLIIPIQESMKQPEKFPRALGLVMIIATTIFLSMGIVGYATFGSTTETVVILNLPQDNRFVQGIQFLYAAAILLSTPLQLFPAIRILENGLFTRSGKYNPGIKWKKNIFRFFLVVFCALVAWGGAGDLDKFVALVGSFACVPLVYVYPVRTSPTIT